MKRKIVWTVILVIVLAAGSWGGYRYYNKEDTQLAASYITTQVRKGTIEVKISGTGSIQPSARATLKANTAGTAAKVNYKQGDSVKKGDILVSYEEDDISDQIGSKNIDIKKKKLELTDLQAKYKSAEDDEARQELVLSIQKQQLDIEMAEKEISSLQTDKSIDPIVAPIDGVLATFEVQAGDSISPNGELGEVVNFAQLQMVVGIDELDISKVKLEQDAEILVEALPNEAFVGKVVAIADEGTTSNGVASFDVTINLLETTDLKVGMSAEASIMTDKKTDALYVPVEAVQSFQGNYFVMVPSTVQSGQGGVLPEGMQNMTDEERAALREEFMANRGTGGTGTAAGGTNTNTSSTTRAAVEVGINNEDNIEILSGLAEGDAVVLPTVVSSSSSNNQSGFPGLGGAGITGGVIPGGGGFAGGTGGAGRQTIGGGAAAGGDTR
ncbi:efflux RND transporter periplasmic adaptor subunit [Cohnella sp.]|uniref:efflux RND transporter periplasmic adaptor subunit n=1 Tax=Cohnella sp. TaxID=1883426 RepID=UPI0035638ABF